ncbi:MAG TPA: long-chain fatty acid--CoA ligase [Actinomycetota bacterium]|nr:long-chain fatty acid--CoA ligase [Actinomycetota bacterium]
MAIPDLLAATAARLPDKAVFVTADGRSVSYSELDAEADRVAGYLATKGISPGDRVAIGMPNIPEFAYAYFGALKAGAVAVPLNVLLTAPEVTRILDDSGARVLFTASPFDVVAAVGAHDASSVESVVTVEKWDELGSSAAEPVARADSDLAALVYTSGTTGEPKGAMLTHGNLLANLRQQMAIPEGAATEEDVLFLALPLFHIFGLNVALGLLVMNGASGVLVERFEPVATLKLIQDHRVSVLFGAPTMYSAWVGTPGAEQYDLSSVRLAVSGAAPLSVEIFAAFKELFGVEIYEGYGLTETAPTLTSNRMGNTPRPGSIGRPIPEVEIRLVDEEGRDVEVGDPGELLVRGPNVFAGYWNREEDTKAAFSGEWFRTGDVAVRDEDGYYYLVDRKRDLIIVSGFNVFPSEIESILLQHPKVAEAAVIGAPHAYTGEAVKAYVVPKSGSELSANELERFVEDRLARFKRPETFELVSELPHLPTGKIVKRALRT